MSVLTMLPVVSDFTSLFISGVSNWVLFSGVIVSGSAFWRLTSMRFGEERALLRPGALAFACGGVATARTCDSEVGPALMTTSFTAAEMSGPIDALTSANWASKAICAFRMSR